jgi:hypothetical protein
MRQSSVDFNVCRLMAFDRRALNGVESTVLAYKLSVFQASIEPSQGYNLCAIELVSSDKRFLLF